MNNNGFFRFIFSEIAECFVGVEVLVFIGFLIFFEVVRRVVFV